MLVSQNKLRIGCFFSCYTDKQRFDVLMGFYVHFRKVFIKAIFCLTPIIDCHNSLRSGIRRTLAEHPADVYLSFYVRFRKVFIKAIVCLTPIFDCHNSLTSGIRRTLAEHPADVYQSSRKKKALYYTVLHRIIGFSHKMWNLKKTAFLSY
jgi:hypothetical protein